MNIFQWIYLKIIARKFSKRIGKQLLKELDKHGKES